MITLAVYTALSHVLRLSICQSLALAHCERRKHYFSQTTLHVCHAMVCCGDPSGCHSILSTCVKGNWCIFVLLWVKLPVKMLRPVFMMMQHSGTCNSNLQVANLAVGGRSKTCTRRGAQSSPWLVQPWCQTSPGCCQRPAVLSQSQGKLQADAAMLAHTLCHWFLSCSA